MPETLHLATVLSKSRDMAGLICAITGTTSGTGFVCARELARKGATVVLLNRKSSRSDAALTSLQEAVPGATFDAIECDLQSFASVRAAASTITAKYPQLDVLVNNAGVMALKDVATGDGYDVQMQTNVLSHFLLTKELFALLKKSPAVARVVNHTSAARNGPPLEPQYFEPKGGDLGGDGTEEESMSYSGPRWARYHQTKLANCCFTYSLKQKLEAAGLAGKVMPLLAHPGLALTSLQVTTAADGGMDNDPNGFMSKAQSAEDGACGIIRAAIDPASKPGDFYGPSPNWMAGEPVDIEPEPLLFDPANLAINWEGCEKAVGAFAITA